jgi:phosphoglycerol transferase MdoB-like AlkP superfamily enzyme
MALDLHWAFDYHIELLWMLAIIFFLVCALVILPVPPHPVVCPVGFRSFILFISATLVFHVFRAIATDFDPFKNKRPSQNLYDRLQRFTRGIDTNESGDAIIDFLLKPLNSSLIGAPLKRNLMIVEIESLERGVLGAFNPKWRKLAPFLSDFVQRGTDFPNVISQPYTTWSVASMFAVQCNLPLLLHRAVKGAQGAFHLLPGLHCIGDFLSKVGYRMISYQTSVFIGRFKEHMMMHQYEAHDFKNHSFHHDWDLFRELSTSVFRELSKEKRPFVLHIANTDTHPTPSFTVDSRCKRRLAGRVHQIVRSYDCLDQILERFFQAFEESPLFQTTEVILYGDHILMEGNEKKIKLPKPRALVLCFPYREQRVIRKPVTLYDLAPTIMQLLGVKYEPAFPFGANLFSADVGVPPSVDDFQTLHAMFTTEMRWYGSATCRGKKGFCRQARS